MKKIKKLLFILVIALPGIVFTSNTRAGDIVGKIVVGYQGWFACPGDGSPINQWWHWTTNWSKPPSPLNQGMVSWPEVSAYSSTFKTAFSNLGNGDPATVFSSWSAQTVDTHFKWMSQNGIDCAALQRFSPYGIEGPTRDDMAEKVKNAAEANGVKFYIMYDVSSWSAMQTQIKEDWINKMSKYTSSPNYAVEDGKPVVVIWGFGFNDNNHPWTPEVCLDVINWFRDQGCYIGGGTPTHWRNETSDSKPGFLQVYHAFDMISPWMVGRISDVNGSDNFYKDINLPDQADCNEHGIDYQPCILPGDLQAGHRANGDFMWRQFYNMIRAGCQGIYISMFDEYNEANQILNTADSYLDIPANSQFRTTSSDGMYISSDFYMRLTDEGGKMLKGSLALSETHTVPFQSAPMWYQSSFEAGYDAMPTWTNTLDETMVSVNVDGSACELTGEKYYVGKSSLKISGEDKSASESSAYFKIIDVDIKVSPNTNLSYLFYPENEPGRYVGIELIMKDGSLLSVSGAKDRDSVSMQVSAGRGIVNSWSRVNCNIGSWLKGEYIDRILLAYDHGPETGNFSALIDNLMIYDGALDTSDLLPSIPNNPLPADGKIFASGQPEILAWRAEKLSQTFTVLLNDKTVLVEGNIISNQTDTFYILPRLKGNTDYYWRIDQTTEAGTTEGPVWTFKTSDPYNSPYNPVPAHLATNADTVVTFSWSAEKADQLFEIYIGTQADLKYSNLVSTQSDTFLYYPLLTTNKTYYWRIDQTSSYGTTKGPVWYFSTINKPTKAKYPKPLDGTVNRDTSLTLSWQKGLYTSNQKIYFGTSNNLDEDKLLSTLNENSYNLTGLKYSTTYYWRIDGINDIGTTQGDVWSFSTRDYPLGSEPYSHVFTAPRIYPNPVEDGKLIIELSEFPPVLTGSIILKNLQGKTCYFREINGELRYELNPGSVSAGVYFLFIESPEQIYVNKIVFI